MTALPCQSPRGLYVSLPGHGVVSRSHSRNQGLRAGLATLCLLLEYIHEAARRWVETYNALHLRARLHDEQRPVCGDAPLDVLRRPERLLDLVRRVRDRRQRLRPKLLVCHLRVEGCEGYEGGTRVVRGW